MSHLSGILLSEIAVNVREGKIVWECPLTLLSLCWDHLDWLVSCPAVFSIILSPSRRDNGGENIVKDSWVKLLLRSSWCLQDFTLTFSHSSLSDVVVQLFLPHPKYLITEVRPASWTGLAPHPGIIWKSFCPTWGQLLVFSHPRYNPSLKARVPGVLVNRSPG